MSMRVYQVHQVKGRGPVVALVEKAEDLGEHSGLEEGSTVRRVRDGATWLVAGVSVYPTLRPRRTGEYLLRGDAMPAVGDELEIVTLGWAST